MRIFVTGHAGYIGAHMVDVLKKANYYVTGCDLDLFKGCNFSQVVEPDVKLVKDVRKLTPEDLKGYDCVVHLAAISNDPMGDINPQITTSINRDGSVHVAKVAKEAGVSRFLFASSCSIYGQSSEGAITEKGSLNPLSAYATSKIEAELLISELADQNFSPAFLRNSTAYGLSPMLRLDLVVNNLLGSALSYGELRVKSDGTPWRPLIHARDIARAFLAFIEAPRETIHNAVVNIGANNENYQVKDVASSIQKVLPQTDVVFTGEVGVDPRNYKVNFDLLNKLLPNFKLEYTVDLGVQELFKAMKESNFGKEAFEGDTYIRLRTLKNRLHLLEC